MNSLREFALSLLKQLDLTTRTDNFTWSLTQIARLPLFTIIERKLLKCNRLRYRSGGSVIDVTDGRENATSKSTQGVYNYNREDDPKVKKLGAGVLSKYGKSQVRQPAQVRIKG